MLRIIIVFVFLSSCKPADPSDPNYILHTEIMVVHDEVMPEMSTIHRIKKKLKNLDTTGEEIDQLVTNLDDADEAMMSWMADYDRPDGSDSLSLAYLRMEKEKISDVSRKMKSAIREGNEFLQNHEAKKD